MVMGVIGWIVLGLIAGFLTSTLVNKRGEGLPMNIVLGIVGAVLGGLLFNTFGTPGVTGFNVWSVLFPVVGAVVVLWGRHAIRRSAWHA
jgi:uncharacterized membrane protein YeaQ/YmgE (transglycosylase-associated protein family)